MRVLVTGANGQLGRELMPALAAAGHQPIGTDLPELNIAVPGAAADAVAHHRPDAVVNCAAYTAVDRAEDEPEAAFLANATGPELLARACAQARARLLHISTDFVFDGRADSPIPEAAVPNPLGVYAETKLAGERAVRAAGGDHIIIRTAWLYGRQGPNFVLTIRRLAGNRDHLSVVADQVGSPTWTGHLAPAIARLLGREQSGIVHLTNQGQTSWHGFAQAIVAGSGLSAEVRPITTGEFPTRARRPPYSVLDNRVWREAGEVPLPDWQVGLRCYLDELAASGTGTG